MSRQEAIEKLNSYYDADGFTADDGRPVVYLEDAIAVIKEINANLERINAAVKECFGDGKVVRYGFMTVREDDYKKLINELQSTGQ